MTEHRTLETGSYLGDKIARSILLPWQPAWIRTTNDKSTGPASQRNSWLKISEMAGSLYSGINTTIDLFNHVTITSTGFDITDAAEVNQEDTNYYWTAQKPGPWVDVGSYVGDGGTATITLGRQPIAIILAQTTVPASQSERVWWKTDTMSTDVAYQMRIAVELVNEITITSTGFQVTGNANDTDEGYSYIALYGQVGSTVHNRTGSYTGAGGTRSISLGDQPKMVTIITDATSDVASFKNDVMPTGNHGDLNSAHSWDSSATGIVIVADGFDVSAEFDGSGDTFHWLAEMR